jgi:hypothetical protein
VQPPLTLALKSSLPFSFSRVATQRFSSAQGGTHSRVSGLWFMVYGLWFMVYGLWFMVYGLWFMV